MLSHSPLPTQSYRRVACTVCATWPLGVGAAAAHLDLLNSVHDEGVLQVLHGPFHPVVEGCSPLGILQV